MNTIENKELEPREVLFKYPQLRHLEIKVGSLEMAAIECAMREYAKEVLTASGSVAAPKEEPIVNEVLYDNGEHSHLELLDHDGRIICSESELESLRDFVRDVDASLYHGPDLEDKEIMQHYIEVFKIIKEEARKLMNTCIQQTEQPEEAKIIEELKAKGARSFINENTALREALKDLLAITETNVFNYNEYKAIIERARKLISK